MIQMRSDDALERGMYSRQHLMDAMAGLRDLASQVIIEAAQHCDPRNFVVGHRMQIFHATHRMPGRYAIATSLARATATGRPPIVAG